MLCGLRFLGPSALSWGWQKIARETGCGGSAGTASTIEAACATHGHMSDRSMR